MLVLYQEITETLYIQECVAIQKDLFNLSDIDVFPYSFFSMIIRKEHPIGVLMGCFAEVNNTKNLIGLGVAIADKEINTAYVPFIGIKKGYQNGIYGYKLLLHLRTAALKNGFKIINALFDPLEISLGKLYTRVGMVINKYITEPYQLKEEDSVVPDKVLINWDIESDYVVKKINRDGVISFKDALAKFSVVKNLDSKESGFLIEIPSQIIQVSKNKTDTIKTQFQIFKKLLDIYINKKNYIITDCFSGIINKQKKNYYLLTKQV